MPVDNVKLVLLGDRLRYERLKRNEAQEVFAARVGSSVPTLRRMENGDPNVAIGYWAAALGMLDHEADLDQILKGADLFELYDIQEAGAKKRQRAKKRQ